MNAHVGSWVLHRKWILAAIGLPILVALGGPSGPRSSGLIRRSASPHRSLRALILNHFIPDGWKARRTKRAGEQPSIRPLMASSIFV